MALTQCKNFLLFVMIYADRMSWTACPKMIHQHFTNCIGCTEFCFQPHLCVLYYLLPANTIKLHCLQKCFAQLSALEFNTLRPSMLCFANNLLKLLSSGESMENALRACCKGIKIGKILIHREGDNGQQVCLFDFCCMCYVESDY